MTDPQRQAVVSGQTKIQLQHHILSPQIIAIPNIFHIAEEKEPLQCNNDEDSAKKEDALDKRFWKKLRMIKAYQNCRFCSKNINILNGVHLSLSGSFCKAAWQFGNSNFWAIVKSIQSRNWSIEQIASQQKRSTIENEISINQQGENYFQNYILMPESIKKLKGLSEYYKYYQYTPLIPAKKKQCADQSEPNGFKVVHNYLNKKITIFYSKIKQLLAEKNSQDSLEIFNENQDSFSNNTYFELNRSKKQAAKRGFGNKSQRSEESVRDLICQIGDSTNVIKSSGKSSFRDRKAKKSDKNTNILLNQYISNIDKRVNEQQSNLKKSCYSHQNSKKKSCKKSLKKSNKEQQPRQKEQPNLSPNPINYKTQPINKFQVEDTGKQEKKLRMSTNISTKKLKKKNIRNSCDNLLNNVRVGKKKIKQSSNNEIKNNFKSYNLVEDNVQLEKLEEKKVRNYILNLKKKINFDKEKIREFINFDHQNAENTTRQLKFERPGQKSSSIRRSQKNHSKEAVSCEIKNFLLEQSETKVLRSGNIKTKIQNSKKRGCLRSGDDKNLKIETCNQIHKTKQKQSEKSKKQQKRSKIKKGTKKSTKQGSNKKIVAAVPEKQLIREKAKNSKIKRDKNNIYNTRIHSSITTEMEI